MEEKNDPIGQAIKHFVLTKQSTDIIVSSDLCDDDVIPTEQLLRSRKEMPKLEKLALKRCEGKVLDIGAGAGAHAKVLMKEGFDVTALEPSLGAVEYMQAQGINTVRGIIQKYSEEKYDTLLLLMNGIGLAGKLENLESFLVHLKSLLNPGGRILCDSTDIMYLYEDEDGSLWVDLNAEYYGNFKFQMKYQDHQTEWFDWLYVDYIKLKSIAEKVGFEVEFIYEEEDQYLVQLNLK